MSIRKNQLLVSLTLIPYFRLAHCKWRWLAYDHTILTIYIFVVLECKEDSGDGAATCVSYLITQHINSPQSNQWLCESGSLFSTLVPYQTIQGTIPKCALSYLCYICTILYDRPPTRRGSDVTEEDMVSFFIKRIKAVCHPIAVIVKKLI